MPSCRISRPRVWYERAIPEPRIDSRSSVAVLDEHAGHVLQHVAQRERVGVPVAVGIDEAHRADRLLERALQLAGRLRCQRVHLAGCVDVDRGQRRRGRCIGGRVGALRAGGRREENGDRAGQRDGDTGRGKHVVVRMVMVTMMSRTMRAMHRHRPPRVVMRAVRHRAPAGRAGERTSRAAYGGAVARCVRRGRKVVRAASA